MTQRWRERQKETGKQRVMNGWELRRERESGRQRKSDERRGGTQGKRRIT